MGINFSDNDILFIYGHFRKKISELEKIKSAPNCPISEESINQEIKLFSSVTDKIAAVYPQLKEMDDKF